MAGTIGSLKQDVRRRMRMLEHRGTKMQCPLCGYRADEFLPGGLHTKRKDAKCPSCGCVERHRIMWMYLSQLAAKRDLTGTQFLHFAPEVSLSRKLAGLFPKYQTSDFGDVVSDFQYDLEKVDCADNVWDFVLCLHVLEHVGNDVQAMREIFRVLKPGGMAFIQIPIWPSESHPTYENPLITDERDRQITFGQHDHHRIYGLDVIERLRSAGFAVTPVRYEEYFDRATIDGNALRNHSGISEVFFVCEKPAQGRG